MKKANLKLYDSPEIETFGLSNSDVMIESTGSFGDTDVSVPSEWEN